MVAFFVVGVYRGVWRHFGMMDTLVIVRGVFFGTVARAMLIDPATSTVFLDATRGPCLRSTPCCCVMAVTLSRASFRLVGEFVQRQRQSGVRVVDLRRGRRRPAWCCARCSPRDGRCAIVGFVDDDPRKAGIRVMGYAVLGGYSALAVLVKAGVRGRRGRQLRRQMPPERLNNLEVLCSENNISLQRLKVGLESIVDGDTPPSESARSRVIS